MAWKKLYQYPDIPLVNDVVICDDLIAVRTIDGLVAIDRKTRKVAWSDRTPGSFSISWTGMDERDEVLLIAENDQAPDRGNDTCLVGRELDGGKELWRHKVNWNIIFNFGGPHRWREGWIFADKDAKGGHHLYQLDRDGSSHVLPSKVPFILAAGPRIVCRETAAMVDEVLYACGAEEGFWCVELDAPGRRPMVLHPGKAIALISHHDLLHVLREGDQTGIDVWNPHTRQLERSISVDFFGEPPAFYLADWKQRTLAWIYSEQMGLLCLDLDSGQTLWQAGADEGWIIEAILLLPDGLLVLGMQMGGEGGYLLEPETGAKLPIFWEAGIFLHRFARLVGDELWVEDYYQGLTVYGRDS